MPSIEVPVERLEKALKLGGNTHTVEDVVEAIKTGGMQCWWNDRAMVVTEVVQYPRGRALNVFLAAGWLEDVMSLQPQIEDFGRNQGCQSMHMRGRKGWRRVLPKHGWSETVAFERKL
jgi:hypothetical protein